MRTVIPALLTCLVLSLFLGCSGSREGQQPSTTLVRGDRQQSRALKSSESRPQPWTREHGVFAVDRFDLQPYVARRRAKHREEHGGQVLLLDSFSHPACAGLSRRARRGCPVLDTPWRRREVAGGVLLVTPYQGVAQQTLHRQVQCHMAFGRVHDSGACPLHLAGVRTTVRRRGDEVQLTIIAVDPAQVGPLRERIQQLVPK